MNQKEDIEEVQAQLFATQMSKKSTATTQKTIAY
tara:strand:- start:1851 stop:1952 length:102 start_codon:yes stop_codon:yes gene_type:complete